MSKPESIMIDDTKYVKADCVQEKAQNVDGLECCVIRSYGAGVFAGYVKTREAEANGINVVLVNSRRIWYWSGACSLSQIAVEGSKNINDCKIAMVVPEQFIANVIEIIPMSKEAFKTIMGAKVWKQ